MTKIPSTPWHRESFDRFLQERLPHLLSERLPLAGYCVESTGPYSCRVQVVLASPSGEVEVAYADVPQPDEAGAFEIDGRQFVVQPISANEHLKDVEVRCVGEQLTDLVEERLGEAPVLLLDDVLSELDRRRVEGVLKLASLAEQVLMTATDADFAAEAAIEDASLYRVQQGRVVRTCSGATAV